jgi:two-component system alkaline phosphatase synthesis response regulator PhoP
MIENRRILLVDDEPDIIEFLQFNFEREGFEVITTDNGQTAVEKALKLKPQVVMMDIMMPEMDGIEACRRIRQHIDTYNPLICLLTARGEDYSQLAGFEAGADEYVVKPVSPKVLIAKVQSLLKLKNGSAISAADKGDAENDIIVDREYYTVIKNKKEIQLPKKEFEILYLMASRPNRLFSRDEIFNHVWGSDTIVGERTMDVYIRKIRSKIGDHYIKTIKGVGYKFIQKNIQQ